jgi:hypothetical protein
MTRPMRHSGMQLPIAPAKRVPQLPRGVEILAVSSETHGKQVPVEDRIGLVPDRVGCSSDL